MWSERARRRRGPVTLTGTVSGVSPQRERCERGAARVDRGSSDVVYMHMHMLYMCMNMNMDMTRRSTDTPHFQCLDLTVLLTSYGMLTLSLT